MQINAKLIGHHLSHLGKQALAHFSATMVHLNTAVGIDIDQRARLIHKGGGKRNTKLHRGQGKPLFKGLALAVEVINGLPALAILGILGKRFH